jgi:uncharacterized protein (TIGR02145 family)
VQKTWNKYLLACYWVIFASFVMGEGTKEFIPPGSTGKGELLVGTNGAHTFATATSTDNYRLYVHIKDFTDEVIRFGFGNASTGNPHYTVHRPDGSELCTGTIPKTPGTGYINTYAEAVAGPFPLAGGYTAIECIPDINGDYYLEIHDQHPSGTHLDYNGAFDYFDLTVVNSTSGSATLGRVWSKCWQFDCGSPNNYNDFFDGKVYIYSNDSIVTSIDFIMTPSGSGDPLAFIPAEWDLMCNESGCYALGAAMAFDEARRSVNTTAGYPQYKIFLNDPDSTIYPSGMMGSMLGTPTFLAKCDGTYDISMMATKDGIVEIFIEISTTDPLQNVTLRENVLAAPVVNVVTWDGLDGYGNPVPSGTPVTMTVKYINGLTNFPITNVDINTNGYQVALERPSGSAPLMYWDDQTYFPTLGTTNLTGCQYTTPGDCHVWDWRAFGHDKTINTWWYVASSSAAPATNLVEREPDAPDSIAGPDTVCQEWVRDYTLYPNPLPDADTNGFEWVLTDSTTATVEQTWTNEDTTLTINFSSITPGYKRLKVRGSNGECGFGPFGPDTTYPGILIYVEAKPAITTASPIQICSGQTTNILITSTGPITTTYGYVASSNSADISGYSNGTTNPIQQTLINTGSTVDTVTYAVAGANWNCPGDTTYLKVAVAPLPTDSTSPDSYTICSGDTTDITLVSSVTGTTFTWTATGSSGNISGYSDGSGDSINQVLVNAGYAIETVDYTIVPTANGCNGPPLVFTVTVNPTPDVSNTTTAFAQCDGATTSITLTSNVTGTTYSWTTTASSANLGGYANGSGLLIAQTLTNSGYTIDTVTYTVLPEANGCTGTAVDFTVAVYPTPDVSNTVTSFAQCTGDTTNIALTSNVSGTTFAWTASGSSGNVSGFSNGSGSLIAQELINSGYINETVTYTVTPTANGCTGIPVAFTVTVYPGPDVSNAVTIAAICNGETTAISLTSNVSGTTFSWTTTSSSPNLSGYADGSGSSIAQTITNSGYTIETVTYTVTPQANGCPGNPVDFIVTVYPTPDISNSITTDSVCNGEATAITLTSNVSGTTFSWTTSGSSGNVGGYANGSGSTIAQTLTNSGYNAETVTYTVTPSANGCTGSPVAFVVTVFPTPDVSNTTTSFALCDGETTAISLASNVTGTTFDWTTAASSPNLGGYSNGTGSLIAQTLTNSGFTNETVTYTITPYANGCTGHPVVFTVTVYPTPDVSNTTTAFAQCDGATTSITLTSNVTGTTYSWTTTASSANLGGYANGSGLLIAQTLTNSGYTIDTVTYTVLPEANGCTGTAVDFTVAVYPTPDVSNTVTSFAQCTGDTTNIALTSNVSGTTFAWTASGSSGNVSGFSNGSGSLIAQELINSGYINETVTYTVTPTANGCTGIPVAFTVTVYPGPDVSNAVTIAAICNGETTAISLTSNVSGTTFSWTTTSSSPNLSGYADGSGSSIAQTITNSGYTIETVTYTVTPQANGCPGNPVDFIVTVHPTPDVSNAVTAFAQCNNDTTDITLTSNVSGTTFSWTASGSSTNVSGYSSGSGNTIQQTLTNNGYDTENVVYTVTPSANGCIGNAVLFTVTVYPTPDVSTVTGGVICTDDTTEIYLTSNVSGTSYTWLAFGSSPNVTGYADGSGALIAQQLFNTGLNTEEVKYQVTPWIQACIGIQSDLVTEVLPAPDLNITPLSQEFCSGQTTSITLSSTIPGATFHWTTAASSPALTGQAPGSGNLIQQTIFNTVYTVETVTYSIIPIANGCRGSGGSAEVTIDPLPWMDFSLCDPYDLTTNAKPLTLKGGLPFNGTYSGPGVSGGIFDPGIAGLGTHTITYTYTNMYGCMDNRTQTLTVLNPIPHNCGDPLTDIRDNQTYQTIQVGTQCWMKENLNFGTMIPSGNMQRDNCIPEKYCLEDDPGQCALGSALYQWNELMSYQDTPEGQGMCPPGWHLPSEDEWNMLFALYYNNAFAGDSLKEGGVSQFEAGLHGVRFNNVVWEFHDWAVMFWSSSPHGPSKAWAHGMNSYNHSVSYYPSYRHHAFPVRCVKN